jgi:hypothetical protein
LAKISRIPADLRPGCGPTRAPDAARARARRAEAKLSRRGRRVGQHHAVRGWLDLELEGAPLRFAAHSLVRDADGTLLDPTFLPSEPVLPFVPHPRQIGGFFALLCGRNAPHELLVFNAPQ